MFQNSQKDSKSHCLVALILLVSFHFTRIHFSQHQAISFFLVTLLTFIKKRIVLTIIKTISSKTFCPIYPFTIHVMLI